MPQPMPARLTDEERELARRTLLVDGVFARQMDALTGGIFLAGLGLYVGADQFLIGLLASLPFLAQAAQLGAVTLLLRIQDRRRVVLLGGTVARGTLVLLAVLVWWKGASLGAPALVALTAFGAVATVFVTAAWNWWVRDVIPRDELGRYFGRRLKYTTLAAAVTLLVAGYLLDGFIRRGRPQDGYAVLNLLGGLCGFVSLAYLARTPQVAPVLSTRRGGATRQIVSTLADPSHRRMALALTLVAATLTIALPFSAVFLLAELGYGFLTVSVFALVSQLAYVAGLRGWGHLSDRFGNRPVLQISLGLTVAALLGWAFVSPERTPFLFAGLLLIHFLNGFGVGGIELTSSNILLKSAPEVGTPAYFAAMSLVRAVTAGLVTLAAGAAWQTLGPETLATFEFVPGLSWKVGGFHLLALASCAVGVAALAALPRIEEAGGARVPEVAKAMRREVRMISSIAGIRAFVHVVSYVVEFVAQPPVRRRRPPQKT